MSYENLKQIKKNPAIECPADSICIISSDDVESWYVHVQSGTNFPVILSVSSLMDETKRYFIDDVVPNMGNITFKDTFVTIIIIIIIIK